MVFQLETFVSDYYYFIIMFYIYVHLDDKNQILMNAIKWMIHEIFAYYADFRYIGLKRPIRNSKIKKDWYFTFIEFNGAINL